MIIGILKRSMSQNVVMKLITNAETAEKSLTDLRSKLEQVKKIRIDEKKTALKQENKILAVKVDTAKAELIKLEILNGKKQYNALGKAAAISETVSGNTEQQTIVKKDSKKVKDLNKNTKDKPKESDDSVVDVRKLDFRIGKIVEISKHPDADSLYVEKIDCGEEKLRTVVSGLVNHVPIDEMRERMVMILCNLKPVKMRGVTSEAMVMCASSPEKVEVLVPPQGATPGDLVSCEGYPREPEAVLNPKKKIFETCAPDLMTNNARVVCYKGTPLIIPGKGQVVAPTLKGVNVK